MYKTDNFNKYTFQYLWSDREVTGLQKIHFEYDTPGSNINRKSSIQLKVKTTKAMLIIFVLSNK